MAGVDPTPEAVREPEAGRPSLGQLVQFISMTTIWGSSFFFTSLALASFSPFLIVLVRLLLAVIVLGAIIAVVRPAWPRTPALWGHFALLGLISIALPYSLLTWAQRWVASSTAIVLSCTTPMFVMLAATVVLRTERFRPIRLVGVLISFAGVALLSAGGSGTSSGLWSMMIVLTCGIFALANVYTRRFVADIHPVVTAFLQLGFGAVLLVPVVAVTGSWIPTGEVTLTAALALVELGVLASAVCYLLFFSLIRSVGSTTTSLNTYLQPIVGVLLGVAVLGERPTSWAWTGIAVVIAGMLTVGLDLRTTTAREPSRPHFTEPDIIPEMK